MSMNTYSLQDTGLLIRGPIAAYIILHSDRQENNVAESIQELVKNGQFHSLAIAENASGPMADYLDGTFAHELLQGWDIETVHCGEFEGCAETLTMPDETYGGSRTWAYDDDPLAYVALSNEPSLFKAAYESIDDIVAELRAKLSGILPDDLDIRPYIVTLSGTYFC